MQAIIDLFGRNDLMPHGFCLSWTPVLLWLHVISDLAISAAYFSIPLTLLFFARKRKDFPYPSLLILFALFIVACGLTHLFAAITVWEPVYWLDGLLKGFTAVISVITAILMWRIIPKALSLPGTEKLQAEISHRKAAENELREANAELQKCIAKIQLLLDSALDGVINMDHHGRIAGWNKQAEQIFAYSAENVIGLELAELIIPPRYRKRHREGLARLLNTGKSTVIGKRLEVSGLRADGTEFPMELTINSLFQDGRYYFSAYVRDISDRIQKVDKLKASEAKFRSIIEVSPVPMALHDGNGKISFLNSAFINIFGYDLTDIPTLNEWWPNAYPDPKYRQWVIKTWQMKIKQAMQEKQAFAPMEFTVCSKNGNLKTVLANAVALSDSQPIEYLAVLYDVTELKQAELAKRHSEAQLQAFYELDLVGLTITSIEKGWMRTNDCLCKMLEYPEATLHRMTWTELTHPDDLEADLIQFNRLLANEIDGYSLEKRFISRSGKVIPTKLVVRGVRKADGELDYVMAMVEDISEYKQAEAELKRSNAELEQFAYAVSHDMRQPLRMITSYLSLIETALSGKLDEETQQFLFFAVNGAKRMDEMILSLLEYSRIGRKFDAKTLCSSKTALNEALAFLTPELDASGGSVSVSGDWPELFASPDELTRLVQNLIGNALKYHQENQAPIVRVNAAITGNTLRVEVSDKGIGIEPKQINRLFKVFSRLQARSRFEGTGIGLALCRKIVEHHGGTIGAASEGEGFGSVFWFELPLQQPLNPPKQTASKDAP